MLQYNDVEVFLDEPLVITVDASWADHAINIRFDNVPQMLRFANAVKRAAMAAFPDGPGDMSDCPGCGEPGGCDGCDPAAWERGE